MTFARTHHRLAHFGHDRADVSEIEVNQARHDHQVSDRADALLQHFVCKVEGFLEGGFGLRHQEQVLVGNDDQGIDVLLQLLDPRFGAAHPARAFKQERLGHHADSQHTLFARCLGHDRSCTGAGAATHAGGDEAHVHAIERTIDFSERFLSRSLAHFRTRTRAKPLSNIRAQLDTMFGD